MLSHIINITSNHNGNLHQFTTGPQWLIMLNNLLNDFLNNLLYNSVNLSTSGCTYAGLSLSVAVSELRCVGDGAVVGAGPCHAAGEVLWWWCLTHGGGSNFGWSSDDC